MHIVAKYSHIVNHTGGKHVGGGNTFGNAKIQRHARSKKEGGLKVLPFRHTKNQRGRSMQKNQEQLIAEEIWLNYFNDYLFQKQLISETERNTMKNLIGRRAAAAKKEA